MSVDGTDGLPLLPEPFELDYDLPAECIATRPVEPRDHSRLLVSRAGAGEVACPPARHVCNVPP
jgi:S-adenosylmethionine:tRNA-ribosyltransferase-isomerase (queuine synthetase)